MSEQEPTGGSPGKGYISQRHQSDTYLNRNRFPIYMYTVCDYKQNYDGREPVTRRVHNKPWIANLEQSIHAKNTELVISEALDAVFQTNARYVSLITHESQGHPATYLYDTLESVTKAVEFDYCGRCECGGHVTTVEVQPESHPAV
jgi:putative CGCGG family rSAM target protein